MVAFFLLTIMVETEIIQEVLQGPKTILETRIDTICNAAELVYPGNWCLRDAEHNLKSKFGANNTKRLVIRFPKSTIKGGSKNHTITDSYIAIPFTADYAKMRSNKMYMLRTKASILEYSCGYFHSHAQNVSGNESSSILACGVGFFTVLLFFCRVLGDYTMKLTNLEGITIVT